MSALAEVAPATKTLTVPIQDIHIAPTRRPLDRKTVERLKLSIPQVGVIQKPTVRRRADGSLILVTGGHRLQACRELGWWEIEVEEKGFDDLHGELAEIDENLCRKELIPLEISNQLRRRKQIHEELHPETRAGAAQAGALRRAQGKQVAEQGVLSFAAETAARTGMSERMIRYHLQIASRLTLDAQEALQGSKLETVMSELLALSKQPPEDQLDLVRLVLDGRAKKVVEAVQMLPLDRLPAETQDQLRELGLTWENDKSGLVAFLSRSAERQALILAKLLAEPRSSYGSGFWSAERSVRQDALLQLVDEKASKGEIVDVLVAQGWEQTEVECHISNLLQNYTLVKKGKSYRQTTEAERKQIADDKSREWTEKYSKEREQRDEANQARRAKLQEVLADLPAGPLDWGAIRSAMLSLAKLDYGGYEVRQALLERFEPDEAPGSGETDWDEEEGSDQDEDSDQVDEPDLDYLLQQESQLLERIRARFSIWDSKRNQHTVHIDETVLVGLRTDQPLFSQRAACDAIHNRRERESLERPTSQSVLSLTQQGYDPEQIHTFTGLPFEQIRALLQGQPVEPGEVDQVDEQLRAAGELLERELTADDVPGQLALPGCSPELEERICTWCRTATRRIAAEFEREGVHFGSTFHLKIAACLEECLNFIPLEFLAERLQKLPEHELALVLAKAQPEGAVGRPGWLAPEMAASEASMWWNGLTDEARRAIKAYFVARGRVWGIVPMNECRAWWEETLARSEPRAEAEPPVDPSAAPAASPLEQLGVEVEPYSLNRSTWRVTREIPVKALSSCSMCSKPGTLYHPASGRRCCEAHVPHGTEEVTRYVLAEPKPAAEPAAKKPRKKAKT